MAVRDNTQLFERGRFAPRTQMAQNFFFSPTHKRTERNAPVWGSEVTIEVDILQGGSVKIAPTLNVKFWVLVTTW
jgi:hypothetical protein